MRGDTGERLRFTYKMKPANLLLIVCDEHNPRVLGCAGHPMIRTPNLDRLAAEGVRFSDAYCNSPLCVPSRAAPATGRYVHRIRFWDNAIPYRRQHVPAGHQGGQPWRVT
jgi:choline-sulfatase